MRAHAVLGAYVQYVEQAGNKFMCDTQKVLMLYKNKTMLKVMQI